MNTCTFFKIISLSYFRWSYDDQYLSVKVKSTQEGGVEDEDSTEKFLVEPEVTDLDQDVVVGHRERFFSKTR